MIKIDTADGFVWINRNHIVSFSQYGPTVAIRMVGGQTYYAGGVTAQKFLEAFEGNYL